MFVTRTGLTAASLAAIAMTACSVEKDETGGRPVIESTTQQTAANVTETKPATPATPKTSTVKVVSTSGEIRGSTVPVSTEYSLGEVAFRDKRYGDAVTSFGEYVAARPENPWGHYMLGLSLWKTGDFEKARSEFSRTIELDPRHIKGLLNLSRVLLDEGKPREAREYVVAALKVDSMSSDAHHLMGRVHMGLKQNEEAIVSFRLALVYNPNNTWSMNNIGLILLQQQKFSEAVRPLAQAVLVDSGVAVYHNNLGIALEHLGQYSLAASSYRKALEADKNYTKAVMSLARVDGRKEDPALVKLDLATIAGEFDKEVRTGVVAVARK
jgi:Flp pilus assembly protein TadD